jgi:endonuclease/exonuclease/phosphatase family metal-dependent hydrolase
MTIPAIDHVASTVDYAGLGSVARRAAAGPDLFVDRGGAGMCHAAGLGDDLVGEGGSCQLVAVAALLVKELPEDRNWRCVMVVRIGTWNLENLFRPVQDDESNARQAYEAKLDALAATITTLAPDVLAVQEVGGAEALADLAERVGGQWHQETADPDGRGIRVGFLSRTPFTHVEQVSAFPEGLRPIQVDDTQTLQSTMGRPALHVQLDLAGRTVDIVTCHVKSKLLTYPGGGFSTRDEGLRARFGAFALARRAAEAVTVRAMATRLLSANHDDNEPAAVVVLGDLNDEPDAATTQILLGPPGSEIGTGGFDKPDHGDTQRLWNLAQRIPEQQRFTRIYHGRHELIDHILVSHALVGLVDDGNVTTEGAGPTPSITDDPNTRRAAAGSDHRPVLALINL